MHKGYKRAPLLWDTVILHHSHLRRELRHRERPMSNTTAVPMTSGTKRGLTSAGTCLAHSPTSATTNTPTSIPIGEKLFLRGGSTGLDKGTSSAISQSEQRRNPTLYWAPQRGQVGRGSVLIRFYSIMTPIVSSETASDSNAPMPHHKMGPPPLSHVSIARQASLMTACEV